MGNAEYSKRKYLELSFNLDRVSRKLLPAFVKLRRAGAKTAAGSSLRETIVEKFSPVTKQSRKHRNLNFKIFLLL